MAAVAASGRSLAFESRLDPPYERPGTIARPGLTDRLRAGRRHPVVVVQAPAGYGKTTLAEQWAAEDGRRVAWCSLGEEDNDPATLVAYLAATLERAGVPEIAGRGPAAVTRALVQAVGALREPTLLVLDDLHLVRSRPSRTLIFSLVRHIPSASQILITTRTPLEQRLVRAGSARGLLTLGAANLRLSDSEAAALSRAAGAPLGDSGASEVNALCEGWAAGVYLAALARRANGKTQGSRFSGADRAVQDYFSTEILRNLGERERNVLLRGSALERMCGSLVDAALGIRDSASVLEALGDAQLFVIKLDGDEEGWFRLHGLFRESLRAQHSDGAPDDAQRILRRASDWYSRRGQLETALACSVSAGARDAVAELALPAVVPALLNGRSAMVEDWLALMDDPLVLETDPAVAAAGALHHALAGRAESADRWARAACSSATAAPVSPAEASCVGLLRALLCRDGVVEMVREAQRTLEASDVRSALVPPAHQLLAFAYLLLGDESRADHEFAQAALEAEARGYVGPGIAISLGMRALLAARRRQRSEAVEFANEARETISHHHLEDSPASLCAYVASARLAIQAGARGAAQVELARAERFVPQLAALPWAAILVRLELAHLHLALGSTARALTYLAEIDETKTDLARLGVLEEEVDGLRRDIEQGRSTTDNWRSILTPAERRLLPLLTTHLSFKQIADRLGISRNTVKTQAISVYRKLDVSSRSQAIQRAAELGLI